MQRRTKIMRDLLMLPVIAAIVLLGLVYVILGLWLCRRKMPAEDRLGVIVQPLCIVVFVTLGMTLWPETGLGGGLYIFLGAVFALAWGVTLARMAQTIKKP